MSRTRKPGKKHDRSPNTDVVHIKSSECSNSKALKKAFFAVVKRHTWGSTHRIRQRNRHLWSHLLGRARRIIDEKVIEEQIEQAEETE
jgi:hypothetical protein